MLETWLRTAAGAAGVEDPGDPALLSDEAVTVLLDLARDAAHGVARPAAPLATFALGLAVGQTGGDLAAARAFAARIVAAAGAWEAPPEEDGA